MEIFKAEPLTDTSQSETNPSNELINDSQLSQSFQSANHGQSDQTSTNHPHHSISTNISKVMASNEPFEPSDPNFSKDMASNESFEPSNDYLVKEPSNKIASYQEWTNLPSSDSQGKTKHFISVLNTMTENHMNNTQSSKSKDDFVANDKDDNSFEFAINSLTLHDFDTYDTFNVNDSHIENLKSNQILFSNTLEILKIIEEIAIDPPYNLKFEEESINRLQEKIKQREKLVKDLDERIKYHEICKNAYKTSLHIPPLGKNDYVDIKQLALSNIKFSNNIETSLNEWWKKLSIFGFSNNFSEKAYKFSINILTTKEAFDVYYHYKDEPLETILRNFVLMFGPIKGLSDYQNDLQNFERREKENIKACMARLDMLLEKTQVNIPENDRELSKKILKEQYLLKLAHPNAKMKFNRIKDRYRNNGHRLSISECIDIVENLEKQNLDYYSLSSIYCNETASNDRNFRENESNFKQTFTPILQQESDTSECNNLLNEDISSNENTYQNYGNSLSTVRLGSNDYHLDSKSDISDYEPNKDEYEENLETVTDELPFFEENEWY